METNVGLFYTIMFFIILDLVTGILKAFKRKRLKSSVIYNGLLKKAGEIMVMLAAGVIESQIGVPMLTLTILFYIGCEGISIVENMGDLGVPMPAILSSYFEDLHSKGGEKHVNQ